MSRRPPVAYAPLWRTAWRRFRQRPFQYLLAVVGIAIGVAMMVSIDVANSSAQRAFDISTGTIAGKTTHRLVAGPTGVDQQLYVDLRKQGYDLSAPVVEGFVMAVDLGHRPMRLLGVDPFAEAPFRDYLSPKQAQVKLNSLMTTPNAVILSQDAAAEYGLNLGDRVDLQINGEPATVTLVGLIAPEDEIARIGLRNLMIADIATAQELFHMPGRLSHIDLIIPDDATVTRVEKELPADVRLEKAVSQSDAVKQMSAAFTLNLSALSLVALLVGIFLIYNTVTFSVVQRRPLFATMRCLGTTRAQLFWQIMAESLIMGLIGAGLGLWLGVSLGEGLTGLVTRTINDFYFIVDVRDVAVAPQSLLKGLVLGTSAALLATLAPAVEAMRTTPASTLRRSALEGKVTRLMPWLWAAGLGLGSFGVLMLWLPGRNLVFAFLGLFAILIAFALVAPPLTQCVMSLVAPSFGRLVGPTGRMAPRNIVRSLSRTSVAIAALMMAVSVIVGISIMVGSFRQTVIGWLDATLQADIYVTPPSLTAGRLSGNLPADALPTLSGWPGVDHVIATRQNSVFAPSWGRDVDVVAAGGDITNGNRPYRWIDGDEDALWQRFMAGQGVMLSEPLVLRQELGTPPPPITLMTDSGPRTFPVLAVYLDYASDRGSILMDHTSYRTYWHDDGLTTINLYLKPGVDADAVAHDMQAALAGREDLVIQSNRGLLDASVALFDRTFTITIALQLLATVVAVIGVIGALMSLQSERANEFGVLRANGMTIRQLWQLTLMETTLMGGMAGLIALPAGLALAWILIHIINVRSFGWVLQMHLQWGSFAEAVSVAVLAALVAGIYPAYRAGRANIATAVRQE